LQAAALHKHAISLVRNIETSQQRKEDSTCVKQGEPLKTGYWSIAEVDVASKLCEQSQEMHSAHVDSGIDTHRINARHTVHTFLTQKKYRAQTGLHL
jgi:hypothetical protein